MSLITNEKLVLKTGFLLCIFGWGIPLYIIRFHSGLDEPTAALLSKITFILGPLVGPSFVHYTTLLIKKHIIENKLYKTFWALNLSIPILTLCGLIEKGVEKGKDGLYLPIQGDLIILTLVAQASLIIFAFYVCWKPILTYFKEGLIESKDRIACMTLMTVSLAIFCNIFDPVVLKSNLLYLCGPLFFIFLFAFIVLEWTNYSERLILFIRSSLRKLVFDVPVIGSIIFIIAVVAYSISKLIDFELIAEVFKR